MKSGHDGDCTIYACLDNGNPDDGICTCGYGHEQRRKCNYTELFSMELQEKLGFVTDPQGKTLLEEIFGSSNRTHTRCSHG